MIEAGILSATDRVELIDGEVIEMSRIASRHAACVDRVNQLLHRLAGERAIVRVQNPIRLDEYSELQPDLCLLQPREDFYAREHPTSANVMLVVEVADSSVAYDREVKLPLYAQAAVPEVWLFNLPTEAVEIYARPEGGKFHTAREVKRDDTLKSETIPTLSFETSAILV